VQVGNVYEDFGDGILLGNLCGALGKSIGTTNKEPKINNAPKMKIHMLENLKYSFDFIRAEGVKLVNVGAEDIIDGNEKIILGLLWALIVRYSVGTVEMDGISGKAGLLLWCQRQTKDYAHCDVRDFDYSWQDGMAFCALLHRFAPDLIDYSNLTPDNAGENLALAFKVAEERFGIDSIVDVEDILDAQRPDEKVIMTYLSFFFKEFANRMKGEALVKAIHTAIGVTKRHDTWIAEYVSGAQDSKTWMTQKTADLQNVQPGINGFGNTTEAIKDSMGNFHSYKKNDKPGRKGDVAKLEGLLAKLHSSERPNERTLYTPAEGMGPEHVSEQWEVLESQEEVYEVAAREVYACWKHLDAVIARFDQKAMRSSKWLSAQIELFSNDEYGNSSIACESLLDSFGVYQEQVKLHAQGVESLKEMCNSTNMPLHARYPDLMAKLEALTKLLAECENLADLYQKGVIANKQEYAKLVLLLKPETWLNSMEELFSVPMRAKNMAEAVHQLDVFKDLYKDEIDGHKQTIQRVRQVTNPASKRAGVEAKLVELEAKMQGVETQGAAYEKKLADRKDELGVLVDEIKEFNSTCTDFTYAVDGLEEKLSHPLHANSLQEAQALVTEFNEEIHPAVEAIKIQFRDIDKLGQKLYESEEEEAKSVFQQFDLNDLNAKGGVAVKAIQAYEMKLMGSENGFLQVEQRKEALRIQFAELANAFKAWCNEKSAEARFHETIDVEQLTQQLASLHAVKAEHADKEQDLKVLEPLSQQLEAQGVVNNPHTVETLSSLQIEWQVLGNVVDSNIHVTEDIIALNKEIEAWVIEYTAGASELEPWVTAELENFKDPQPGKEGHGDTTPQIKENLDLYYKYKQAERPGKLRQLAALKELFGKLNSAQRKNNRPPHQPEPGQSIHDLEESWSNLEKSEETYEQSVRDSYAHFQDLDASIMRFEVKEEKMTKWLQAQDVVFRSGEIGSSGIACDNLLDNFILYQQQMDLYGDTVQASVTENRMCLHARHPELVERANVLEAKMDETKALAEAYKKALKDNKAEYGKLKQLLKPETFIRNVQKLLSSDQGMATFQSVSHMLVEYREVYTDEVDKHESTLNTIRANLNPESPKAGVKQRLEQDEKDMAAVKDMAAKYSAKLADRKTELSGVVAMVKDYNKQASTFGFNADNLEEEMSVKPECDNIEEAKSTVENFESVTKQAVHKLQADLDAIGEVAKQLTACQEEDAAQAFSKFSVPVMEQRYAELKRLMDEFEAQLRDPNTGLLRTEEDKDALRKKFAAAAEELKKKHAEVKHTTEGVHANGGSLEEQLAAITAIQANDLPVVNNKLAETEPIADELDAKNIINNPYTSENIYSLRAMCEVLGELLEDTAEALQSNIAAEKSGGLSPAQYLEVKEVFDHFDASGDGQLDASEFATCTTAVGLVLTDRRRRRLRRSWKKGRSRRRRRRRRRSRSSSGRRSRSASRRWTRRTSRAPSRATRST
jgi:hypothetical protein